MTPIAHGYDYAWAQIPASAIGSNGGTFVVRYLGGSARLTPQERDNLHAAGVSILLVWETAADEAEHSERGAADGAAANAEADALGYPLDCPIFFADDNNDPDPNQELAYYTAARAASKRPSGMYSGGNVLAAIQASFPDAWLWMVETWFANNEANPHMVQLANTREPAMVGIDPGTYDTNLLYHSIPMWAASGTTNEGMGDFDVSEIDTKVGPWLKDVESVVGKWLQETEARIEAKVSTWLGQLQTHLDEQFAALPASGGGAALADIQKAVHKELQKLGLVVAP